MYLKKGDNVIVIAGKDRGKTGKIVRSLPKENKVVVSGLNMVKKRMRPRREGQKGQVVEVSMPLHASNVALVSGKGTPTRINVRREKGTRERVSKKDGVTI